MSHFSYAYAYEYVDMCLATPFNKVNRKKREKNKRFKGFEVKLTAKGRYAIMALADMAVQGEGAIVPLSDISKRQSISTAYLEQLFRKLRQAEIVNSHRGVSGGYSLGAPAKTIALDRIIAAVDETIRLHSCTPNVKKRCTGTKEKCLTHPLWDALETHIESFFSDITLSQVVNQDFLSFERVS